MMVASTSLAAKQRAKIQTNNFPSIRDSRFYRSLSEEDLSENSRINVRFPGSVGGKPPN